MPRKASRQRVEQGLYRAGTTYIACATPPGQRRPRWKTLGEIGLMEARRLRDEFRVEVQSGRHVVGSSERRVTFCEVADEWLRKHQQLVRVRELAPRTLDAYEVATRLHVIPYFGTRPIRTVGPEDLIDWYADQRASGATSWSIKNRWTALRGILAHAARRRIIEVNPAGRWA